MVVLTLGVGILVSGNYMIRKKIILFRLKLLKNFQWFTGCLKHRWNGEYSAIFYVKQSLID